MDRQKYGTRIKPKDEITTLGRFPEHQRDCGFAAPFWATGEFERQRENPLTLPVNHLPVVELAGKSAVVTVVFANTLLQRLTRVTNVIAIG